MNIQHILCKIDKRGRFNLHPWRFIQLGKYGPKDRVRICKKCGLGQIFCDYAGEYTLESYEAYKIYE